MATDTEEEDTGGVMTACFWVSGDGFTRMVRGMMLDEDHSHALRVLDAAIPELTLAQVEGILTGKLMFTGDTRTGGLDLVEDDGMNGETATYLENYKHKFLGYFKKGSKWYIPEAKVQAYGLYNAGLGKPADLEAIKSYIPPKNILMEMPRSWRYSCRRVDPPPSWHVAATRFEDAIAELGGEDNTLPMLYAGPADWQDIMRGIKQTEYGDVDDAPARPRREPATIEDWNQSNENMLAQMAESVGLSPEAARGVAASLSGNMPTDLPPAQQMPLLDQLHGMIAPDGDFYPCGYMGHANLSHVILKELFGEEVNEDMLEVLLKRGWYQIGRKEILGFQADGKKEPTEAQWFVIDVYARLNRAQDMTVYSIYNRKPGGMFDG